MEYIMELFKKEYLGSRGIRKKLLKARVACVIENANCFTKEFLQKIKSAACGLFSGFAYPEDFSEVFPRSAYMSKYFTQLEELSKLALDILPTCVLNSEVLDVGQRHRPYQYVRESNGVIKVSARATPVPKGVNRDKTDFKSYPTKLSESISRARRVVVEIAENNEWQYFVSFTINNEKFDRQNLEEYMKKFTKWIQNYNRKLDKKIQYLLIPEAGRRGSYHLHGLMNISEKCLTPFKRGVHPRHLVDGNYLNWEDCSNKFGYCSLGEIRSKEAVTRYITEGMRSRSAKKRELGSRLYYCSKGLKRSTEICRGNNIVPVDSYTYENDYVGVKIIKPSV